jgi:probable rRNA maturation factor
MNLSVSFELLKSAAVRTVEFKKEDIAALARFVLAAEKVAGPVELTLELTGHQRIQALNRHFRGVNRTTDVISFRYPHPNPLPPSVGEGVRVRAGFEGDIAINVAQARLQAEKMRHPVKREVRLLWIHGILHLLGYTDYTPKPRRRMFKRQNELLRRWEKSA